MLAGGGLGVKYYLDYYYGTPKDAVPQEEISPSADFKVPEGWTEISSISVAGKEFPVFSYVGEDGSLQYKMFADKFCYLCSNVRKMNFEETHELGLIDLKIEDESQLKSKEILEFFSAENYTAGDGLDIKLGTAQPKAIYASDEDVVYTVKAKQGEVEILDGEEQIVKLTDGDKESLYRFAFLTGSKHGRFFPCDEDGKLTAGALSNDNLYIECKLAGTDTILETEPETEEALAEKDNLINEHKEKRLAEEAAKSEEQKAAEAAAKKAAEEAEKRAAEKKAAEEAAKKREEAIAAGDYSIYTSQTFYLAKNLDRYIAYHKAHPSASAAEVIQAVNTNLDSAFYTNIRATDLSNGYLLLCNKYYQLGAGYVPALEALGAGYGEGYLEPRAAAAFRKMVDAAKAEGIILKSVSPYRSYQTQADLYQNYCANYGQAMADTFSARPGHSEHQTGLGVDINCASGYANFQNTKEYAWLIRNSYKYGFILRYPYGKEYITGYSYEPWHYRYLGPEVATAVAASGLTYEEYYAYYIEK